MYTLPHRTQIFTLSAVALAFMLTSNLANADIYKWRNNRGVIQYSDKPPVSGFSKADRHEIVNSLQSKDMCVEPTAKTAAAAVRRFMANFSAAGASVPKVTAFNQPISAPAITIIAPKLIATAPTLPKPVVTAPAPLTPKPTNVATAPIPPATTPANTNTNTTQNIIQSMLMPAVDININVIPSSGYSTLRIRPVSKSPAEQTTSGGDGGSFRIPCTVSHMSNDDPIVYPNQKGAAHHHTFFGNTSTNYASNVSNMSATGNSTCAGGIANRSAYWMPSMIDTSTGEAYKAVDGNFYYKTGYGGVPTESIVAPPKGLRMITGKAKNTTAEGSRARYSCLTANGDPTSGWTANIPNCNLGGMLFLQISFPQCWNGKDLDSPDHISHMAESGANGKAGCPASHPVAIPLITFNAKFKITYANQAANFRLASDNYAKNGLNAGYSGHSDWVNGWDETVMNKIIKNCINGRKDCHSYLLGDGTTLY